MPFQVANGKVAWDGSALRRPTAGLSAWRRSVISTFGHVVTTCQGFLTPGARQKGLPGGLAASCGTQLPQEITVSSRTALWVGGAGAGSRINVRFPFCLFGGSH